MSAAPAIGLLRESAIMVLSSPIMKTRLIPDEFRKAILRCGKMSDIRRTELLAQLATAHAFVGAEWYKWAREVLDELPNDELAALLKNTNDMGASIFVRNKLNDFSRLSPLVIITPAFSDNGQALEMASVDSRAIHRMLFTTCRDAGGLWSDCGNVGMAVEVDKRHDEGCQAEPFVNCRSNGKCMLRNSGAHRDLSAPPGTTVFHNAGVRATRGRGEAARSTPVLRAASAGELFCWLNAALPQLAAHAGRAYAFDTRDILRGFDDEKDAVRELMAAADATVRHFTNAGGPRPGVVDRLWQALRMLNGGEG